ncbi:MAG: class I SAM-dependent methyltransferase [Candidatus Nanohalobium sp.]
MRNKVKKGYEEGDYESDYREGRDVRPEEKDFFDSLSDLTGGDKLLDLGCGTGVPFDRYLSEKGWKVTGFDIAETHVEKARENVPSGEFRQGDFFQLDFEEGSFDAVVSFYAIFHIPRKQHSKLLDKISRWVKQDGAILITMGAEKMDMMEGDIGGEKMLWSSYSAEKNKEIVKEAGFNIVSSYEEDWREETHLWILAKP